MGRQMRDLLRCGGPSLVLASRHIQSACVPLVVHILPPLTTNSSPFLTALVIMPAVHRGEDAGETDTAGRRHRAKGPGEPAVPRVDKRKRRAFTHFHQQQLPQHAGV
ncbi:hypothetical protein CRUP_023484 [Coryphaenoides rupestris]|nr:hypothetical protein CRUP_023484 [Coryphaenoides rupestris]